MTNAVFGPFTEYSDNIVEPDECCNNGKRDACIKVTEQGTGNPTWNKDEKICSSEGTGVCKWFLRSDKE